MVFQSSDEKSRVKASYLGNTCIHTNVSQSTSVKEIFCSLNIFVRRSPTVGSFIESS